MNNHAPTVTAVIPARGGSKSIPRKNIRPLNGIPLIAYSILAALASERVGRVIVSTDDREIAAAAMEWGAEVPFLRPADLAGDRTPDLPVFEHALTWMMEHEGRIPDIVVQLRPTSPLRPIGSIDAAIAVLLDHGGDSVRTVTPSGQNPWKMWRIEDGPRLAPLLDSVLVEPYNMPRQELPATWWQTGHIEVIRTATIVEQRSLTGRVIRPWEIDPIYAIDLDTEVQWRFAAFMLQELGDAVYQPETVMGAFLEKA